MARRIQHYQSAEIEVTFDPNLCIHAAMCLRALPRVFDVRRRTWIEPEAAPGDEIAATIHRCPSGALHYRRLDGGPAEEPDEPATVAPVPDGPNFVRGDIVLLDGEGDEIAHGARFALCRCGQSENKPFCDNTHRRIGFRAS